VRAAALVAESAMHEELPAAVRRSIERRGSERAHRAMILLAFCAGYNQLLDRRFALTRVEDAEFQTHCACARERIIGPSGFPEIAA